MDSILALRALDTSALEDEGILGQQRGCGFRVSPMQRNVEGIDRLRRAKRRCTDADRAPGCWRFLVSGQRRCHHQHRQQ
jgi:hypothetical protein